MKRYFISLVISLLFLQTGSVFAQTTGCLTTIKLTVDQVKSIKPNQEIHVQLNKEQQDLIKMETGSALQFLVAPWCGPCLAPQKDIAIPVVRVCITGEKGNLKGKLVAP